MGTKIKKALLVQSALLVAVIAAAYGVNPGWLARTFLGLDTIDVAVAHVLRAIMGLYLAMAAFWLVAAFDARLRNPALLTTIVFCGGLLAGRLLSFAADGRPPGLLIAYAVIEALALPAAIWAWRLPEDAGAPAAS